MDKLYGVVKGWCSESCIGIFKNDKSNNGKDETCDVLCLLGKLKQVTSGLDIKANEIVNLTNATIAMAKIYQGRDESDDDYMKRFKGSCDTVVAAGGSNIFCSEEIMEKAGGVLIDTEIKEEVEALKAVLSLKTGDRNRHVNLVTKVENEAHNFLAKHI